jgi:hypothetical protein
MLRTPKGAMAAKRASKLARWTPMPVPARMVTAVWVPSFDRRSSTCSPTCRPHCCPAATSPSDADASSTAGALSTTCISDGASAISTACAALAAAAILLAFRGAPCAGTSPASRPRPRATSIPFTPSYIATVTTAYNRPAFGVGMLALASSASPAPPSV